MQSEISGESTPKRVRLYPEESLYLYTIPFTDDYNALMAQGYIPGSYLRTLVFDTATVPGINMSELIEAISKLNEGRNYIHKIKKFVVALIYTKDPYDFSSTSHAHLMTELETCIHQPFGILCGISQIYNDLRTTAQAFKQSIYSLEYYEFCRREMIIMHEEQNMSEIIAGAAFEQVLSYYLVEENSNDPSFDCFCFNQAFLTSILAEDIKNGTKNFQILWFYLAYECNASLVGRRMFMHRNSVLYHVRQMEKLYDFDLERRFFREKMLLDFRLVFLNLSAASLGKLFEVQF